MDFLEKINELRQEKASLLDKAQALADEGKVEEYRPNPMAAVAAQLEEKTGV